MLPSYAHDGAGVNDTVPPIERLGNELAQTRKMLADLLLHVGRQQQCTGPTCRQMIFMVHHVDSGKYAPYNLDGSSHFITCPDRDLFRRKKDGRAADR